MSVCRWSVVAILPKGEDFLAIARHFDPTDINFPGGSDVPEDVTQVDTLLRIIKEDTGIHIMGWRLMGEPWRGRFKEPVFPYFITEWKGKIRPGGSGKVFWANPERLTQGSSTYSGYAKEILRKLMRI